MRASIVIACCIATLAAGYLAGRYAVPGEDAPSRVVEKIVTVTNVITAAKTAPHLHDGGGDAVAMTGGGDAPVSAFKPVEPAANRSAGSVDASDVLRMKDPAGRAQAFAKLLAGITPANGRTIFDMFLKKGFNTPREEEEIRMIAEGWAAVDGKSAVEYLDSIPHGQRPDNTLRMSLAEWAMHDLDSAESWARAATTNVPNHYMIGIIAGAANVDLSRAQNLLYEMPYGRERGDALAYVAAAHLEIGNSDAMTWAMTIPDPRLQQATIRRVGAQVALTDPSGAANWVVQNSADDALPYNVASVAKEWSYRAPEDAVNWAFSLPAGPAQDAAVASTLPSLAAKDPAAAEKLLVNRPPTQATDPARIRLVREYSETDPVRAIAWANTITDPHAKDHITQRVMESWQQRDPQAAAQFLQPKTP